MEKTLSKSKVEKKKIKESLMVKFGYSVKIDKLCVSSEREDVQWGSWRDEYENTAPRYINRNEEYPDVVTSLKFNPGDHVYMVWIEYSSGDSFGRSHYGYTLVEGLFKDIDSAKELKEAILKRKPDDDYSFKVKTSDGQQFKIYCNWEGYFDSLEAVNIDIVTIFD
jgi:hypothetical protein